MPFVELTKQTSTPNKKLILNIEHIVSIEQRFDKDQNEYVRIGISRPWMFLGDPAQPDFDITVEESYNQVKEAIRSVSEKNWLD